MRIAWLIGVWLTCQTFVQAQEGGEGSEDTSGENESGEVESSARDQNLDQAARLTFQSGQQAFSQGDFETALSRFVQAYELSGRSALLYNVAVTLDRLRRDEEALAKFREYLEAEPNALERAEVEARIRVLEEAVANREASEAETGSSADAEPSTGQDVEEGDTTLLPPSEAGSEEEKGLGVLHPAIALSAAGLALVVGGLIVWSGLDATKQNDEFESYARGSGATYGRAEELFNGVRSAEKRTNILIGVTAGVGVAAAALAVFTDWGALSGGEDDATAPVVSIGPNGFLAGARCRF